jgi:hypothetical protein
MWIQGKDMTQQFAGTLRRKQGGRFISIAIHKYLSTSKTGIHTSSSSDLLLLSLTWRWFLPGITTQYDTVPIAPFHFFKLSPHMLDPRDEVQHQ